MIERSSARPRHLWLLIVFALLASGCLKFTDSTGQRVDLIVDGDKDLVANTVDNCPDHYNPSQLDTDGDKVGDACDACPLDPNQSQDAKKCFGDPKKYAFSQLIGDWHLIVFGVDPLTGGDINPEFRGMRSLASYARNDINSQMELTIGTQMHTGSELSFVESSGLVRLPLTLTSLDKNQSDHLQELSGTIDRRREFIALSSHRRFFVDPLTHLADLSSGALTWWKGFMIRLPAEKPAPTLLSEQPTSGSTLKLTAEMARALRGTWHVLGYGLPTKGAQLSNGNFPFVLSGTVSFTQLSDSFATVSDLTYHEQVDDKIVAAKFTVINDAVKFEQKGRLLALAFNGVRGNNPPVNYQLQGAMTFSQDLVILADEPTAEYKLGLVLVLVKQLAPEQLALPQIAAPSHMTMQRFLGGDSVVMRMTLPTGLVEGMCDGKPGANGYLLFPYDGKSGETPLRTVELSTMCVATKVDTQNRRYELTLTLPKRPDQLEPETKVRVFVYPTPDHRLAMTQMCELKSATCLLALGSLVQKYEGTNSLDVDWDGLANESLATFPCLKNLGAADEAPCRVIFGQ